MQERYKTHEDVERAEARMGLAKSFLGMDMKRKAISAFVADAYEVLKKKESPEHVMSKAIFSYEEALEYAITEGEWQMELAIYAACKSCPNAIYDVLDKDKTGEHGCILEYYDECPINIDRL